MLAIDVILVRLLLTRGNIEASLLGDIAEVRLRTCALNILLKENIRSSSFLLWLLD
jgi:hypothetical protein